MKGCGIIQEKWEMDKGGKGRNGKTRKGRLMEKRKKVG